MKKLMKKLVAVIFTALVAVTAIPCITVNAAETFTVYADVPDGWGNPSIYAWNDIGRVFPNEWPGEVMVDEGNGWYSYEVPVSATGIIINDGLKSGASQTEDLLIDPVDMWIVVNNNKTVEILYEAPEGAPGGPTIAAPPDTSGSLEGTSTGQAAPDGTPTQGQSQSSANTPNEGGTTEFNPLTVIIPAICVTAIIIILIVSLCANKKTNNEE